MQRQYGLDADQQKRVAPLIERYLTRAEAAIAEHTTQTGSAGPIDARRDPVLAARFLDLQLQLERGITPHLSPEQFGNMIRREPIVFMFMLNTNEHIYMADIIGF